MLSPAIINLEKFNIWILNHPIGSTVDDLPTLFFGALFFLYRIPLCIYSGCFRIIHSAKSNSLHGLRVWNFLLESISHGTVYNPA